MKRLDTDLNGRLSAEEFAKNKRFQKAPEKAKEVFEKADTDKTVRSLAGRVEGPIRPRTRRRAVASPKKGERAKTSKAPLHSAAARSDSGTRAVRSSTRPVREGGSAFFAWRKGACAEKNPQSRAVTASFPRLSVGMIPRAQRLHPADDAIVVALTDWPAGAEVAGGEERWTVREKIPAKHKFAARDLRPERVWSCMA